MSWCSRRSAWRLLLAALVAAAAQPLPAQATRETQLWGVALSSRPALFAAGAGLARRDRGRTRLGASLAVGASDAGRLAGRAEAAWHFLLDPGRRSGIAFYGGGGLALSLFAGEDPRPFVQAVLGVEQAPGAAGGAFMEVGIGGGVRLAAGWRWRKHNAPSR